MDLNKRDIINMTYNKGVNQSKVLLSLWTLEKRLMQICAHKTHTYSTVHT